MHACMHVLHTNNQSCSKILFLLYLSFNSEKIFINEISFQAIDLKCIPRTSNVVERQFSRANEYIKYSSF